MPTFCRLKEMPFLLYKFVGILLLLSQFIFQLAQPRIHRADSRAATFRHFYNSPPMLPSIGEFMNFPTGPRHFPQRWPLTFLSSDEEEAIFESAILPFVPISISDWQPEEVPSTAGEEDAKAIFVTFGAMNWTQAERGLVERLVEQWQFENLLNFFYAKVLEMPETERKTALSLLERYSPPKSLVDALQAMTSEQKGHIQELIEAGRRRAGDLRRIARGLVASLPDESHKQANRFVQMANNFLHMW